MSDRSQPETPPWQYERPTESAVDRARGDFWPRLWRPFVHLWFRILLRLVFRFRVVGRHHIPRKGPFILVANHSGHPDAVVLMAALPLRRVNTVHPLAAKDYFFRRRFIGVSVHALLNALPIDRRARSAKAAMADGLELLRDGRGVILFPEGTRSDTGEIAPFKTGVGLLLAGTQIPAIPAYIEGSREVLPKGALRPHLARLNVRIGAPITFEYEPQDVQGWRAVAEQLEQRVRDLAP